MIAKDLKVKRYVVFENEDASGKAKCGSGI